MKYFTLQELKDFDGKAGRPAYVAFKGKVYDVTNSRLWVNGDHRGRHIAGGDMTPGMINAPHNEEVFKQIPIVGELKEETYTDKLQKRIERLHFHSQLVHFSVALALVIPLFALVYLISNDISFEKAAYYLLILLLITTPFSGVSGFFSWEITYEGRRTRIFNLKIIFTIALTVLIIACSIWRILVPNILAEKNYLSYFYFILLLGISGITAILGHYGGRIVYS